MLELRFKLQKNHISKTSKKSKTAHLRLRTNFCSKNQTKIQKQTQNQKKNQKKYFFKSISNFKISYNQIPSM
jgi:hypothetical protein